MMKLFSKNSLTSSEGKTSSSFFQPKLAVNKPGDQYEREADAAAERVMRMNKKSNADYFIRPSSQFVQRKCAECEKEKEHIQKKESSSSEKNGNSNISSYVQSISSGGVPLPESTRKFFESRFDYDFSSVKIHTDVAAAKSAQAVNALAYTTGNNIVFNQNQFSPETNSGKKLLAHELTHVIQQRDLAEKGLSRLMIQRQPEKDPSFLDDEQLMSEYESYREYVYYISPEDHQAEEGNMEYFLALEKEVKKRCIKASPLHPKTVGKKLIDRITGVYRNIDGDQGEGLFLTPYLAPEGQCTIGYGHVIFPKSSCNIESFTERKGDKEIDSHRCICQPPWNSISPSQAIVYLNQDMQTHINEVNKKIKVDLNQDEFDAMVDLSAHHGSMPQDFADYVNENWCTNKEAVRNRYLQTDITMKHPQTKRMIRMQNFVDRRKRRVW